MIRILFLAFCILAGTPAISLAQTKVALELVLAVDTSASVDREEFDLQRQGFAEAFSHPDLIALIEGIGSAGIAVMMVEWSGKEQQQIVVDWSLLRDRASSELFAQRLLTQPRSLRGSTDIGSALEFSIAELSTNRFVGNRRVIDVSGDGRGNTNTSEMQRDIAVENGITINGLVIFNDDVGVGAIEEVDLVRHYANKVIGGNGAFLMTAKGFDDFRNAILRKLMREILGTGTAALAR